MGALFAAAMLIAPSVIFAASINTDSQDLATLRVANNTTNPAGTTDQWRSSANASAGDEVSFLIYYHNVGPDTATNVRVKLNPQTTGSGTAQSFSASVSADNASTVYGNASVNLSSSQSISYISGATYWYPNQSDARATLLSGQTGAELFSGAGLNIGNIEPGWPSQGNIVVTFRVSSGSTPSATTPTVTTNNATNISQMSAALNGYVNPNGTTDTTRWFEWGTSSSNLNNQTTHYAHGTTADGFSTSIWNLAPNTTYYFRAVAQNSQGNVPGQTLSFVTGGNNNNQSQPTITTQPATNNGNDFAVLNGYVDPNGTTDTTRWFEWGTYSSSMNNQTTHYNQGSSAGNFSANLYGLSQNTTYYYRAVAQNSQGTVYANIVSFTLGNSCYNNNWYGNCGNGVLTVNTRNADTSGTFAALNGYVDPNGSGDTVHWFEWGTNSSLGQTTPFVSQGSTASSFSATITGLYPNTTYYYRAVARNSTGTVPGPILSFTTTMQSNNNNNSGAVPTLTTLLPTELTNSSAKLNGLVFTTSNQSSNAWFEWGTNTNLTNRTSALVAGTLPVVRVADTITGLSSGQTYYYRIVAENNAGRAYGSTLSFVAGGIVPNNDTTVDTTPVRVTRNITVVDHGTGTESLVTLTVDGGDETIAVGEKRVYHVTWKNESAKSLHNVVLRVTFPQAMTVESATRGSFSSVDNAVVVDLKTLASAEKGETFIFATAGKDLKLGQLIVVTANMVYTSPAGTQGDAIAYVTHRAVAEGFTSGLGANIFGAGSFLPETLLGWMILIILILALVLLGNHVYGRFGKSK